MQKSSEVFRSAAQPAPPPLHTRQYVFVACCMKPSYLQGNGFSCPYDRPLVQKNDLGKQFACSNSCISMNGSTTVIIDKTWDVLLQSLVIYIRFRHSLAQYIYEKVISGHGAMNMSLRGQKIAFEGGKRTKNRLEFTFLITNHQFLYKTDVLSFYRVWHGESSKRKSRNIVSN